MKLIALIATAVVAVFGLLLTAIVWLAVQRKNLKISLVNLQRSINKHIAEFSAKEKDFEDRILKAKARIGDLELSCTGYRRELAELKKKLMERNAELDRYKKSRHNVRCQHCRVLVKTGETLCKKCKALGYGVTSKGQVAKEELAPIDNDPEPKPLLADAEVGDEVTLRSGERSRIWSVSQATMQLGKLYPIFAAHDCYQLDGKLPVSGDEHVRDIVALRKKSAKPLLSDAEVGDEVMFRNGEKGTVTELCKVSDGFSEMGWAILGSNQEVSTYAVGGKYCLDGEHEYDIVALRKKNKVNPEPYCDGVASKRDASNVC